MPTMAAMTQRLVGQSHGVGRDAPNGTATRPGGHVRRDLVTLLADLSRTAPPASSRFRRSPCLRRETLDAARSLVHEGKAVCGARGSRGLLEGGP